MRELLKKFSGMQSIAASQDDGTVKIRGFVSTESQDRSQDFALAEAFRIERFMTSPTVLVNHEFWVDGSGNKVSVGKVSQMYVAVARSHPTDPTLYEIVDQEGNVRDTYPKSKVPDLSDGSRGVFAHLEITQPEIAKRVARGELSAFSWKGFVNAQYTATGQKVFRDIDLLEVSVVDIPDGPSSTFVVEKCLGVQSVVFDKSIFDSESLAQSFLAQYGFSSDIPVNHGDSFVFVQKSSNAFESSGLTQIPIQDGVSVVAGVSKTSIESPGQPLSSELTAAIQNDSFHKAPAMTQTPEAVVVDDPQVLDTAAEAKEATNSVTIQTNDEIVISVQEKGVVRPSKNKSEIDNSNVNQGMSASNLQLKTDKTEFKSVETDAETLIAKSAEAVLAQINPRLDQLAEALTALTATHTQSKGGDESPEAKSSDSPVEDETPAVETETAVSGESTNEVESSDTDSIEPSFQAEIVESIQMIAKAIDETASRLDSLSDEVEVIAKNGTPSPPRRARREYVQVEKSNTSDDANSCMDSLPLFNQLVQFRGAN